MCGAYESKYIRNKGKKPKDKQQNRTCTFDRLLIDFFGLLGVYFLCQNLSMKDIFNPYLSNDEKDILCEMQRLEELDATISDYSELFKLSATSTALPGQIVTVAESVSTSG